MSTIVVRPLRFTDNIDAMQAFLETLGLRPRIQSEEGSWVDMVAGGGMVALHSAETSDTGGVAGATRLSFEVDDVDVLAGQLMVSGVVDVAVYDEAYGKALDCRDPLGDVITVGGRSDDLYGFRLVGDERPDSRVRVVPVRFADPGGPLGGWLEAMGLQRVGAPNDFYVMYGAGGGEHGYVGVHHVYTEELPIVPGPAAVHLTFATSEPLDDVARRLADSGFQAPITREEFGSFVTVTDPDGQEVQIHESPPQ
jgi:hypothetical protein